MKVIGITGGIGAGKSEVLKYLSDNYKCEIIMTDDVAKSLYYKGSKAYQMITMLFGDDVSREFAAVAGGLDAAVYLVRGHRERVSVVFFPLVVAFAFE